MEHDGGGRRHWCNNTQASSFPLLPLPEVKEMLLHSPAGCQGRVKGKRNESYGAGEKNPVQGLGSWMVYTLAASLRFVLVSQFVGKNCGRSKKSQLSPKAWELLNVTQDHSATRERREKRGEKIVKRYNKKKETETVTEDDKEERGVDGEITKKERQWSKR